MIQYNSNIYKCHIIIRAIKIHWYNLKALDKKDYWWIFGVTQRLYELHIVP